MVELQVYQHFEDHPYHQGTDKDRHGPQNIGLLGIQSPDMAANLRIFECCLPRKIQLINLIGMNEGILHWFTN